MKISKKTLKRLIEEEDVSVLARRDEWDNLIDVLSVYVDKPEVILASDGELIARAEEEGYVFMKTEEEVNAMFTTQ